MRHYLFYSASTETVQDEIPRTSTPKSSLKRGAPDENESLAKRARGEETPCCSRQLLVEQEGSAPAPPDQETIKKYNATLELLIDENEKVIRSLENQLRLEKEKATGKIINPEIITLKGQLGKQTQKKEENALKIESLLNEKALLEKEFPSLLQFAEKAKKDLEELQEMGCFEEGLNYMKNADLHQEEKVKELKTSIDHIFVALSNLNNSLLKILPKTDGAEWELYLKTHSGDKSGGLHTDVELDERKRTILIDSWRLVNYLMSKS